MKNLNAKTIYCDMDGVIADFFAAPNAVERFAIEKDFFYNLKPIRKNLNAIKKIIKQGLNVKILTASPHEQADNDKIKWLKKYLGNVNYIICRVGQNKSQFVDDIKNSLLLDDYIVNITQWRENGGKAIHIGQEVKDITELLN